MRSGKAEKKETRIRQPNKLKQRNEPNKPKRPSMIVNALTIDVEDYFQVHAFSSTIRREDWDSFEPRVEKNTHRILDLLDSVKSNNREKSSNPTDTTKFPKGTFFVLGWIADRFPKLVKEIHRRGHEVACHGYAHKCIFDQTRNEFKEDVKRAKAILEDLIGEAVIGYRAPTYSITKKSLWALEILYELGFLYDSSIFPIHHDIYGISGAPRFPFSWNLNGSEPQIIQHSKLTELAEYPISTAMIFGQKIPIAGGGYFRLFPYWFTKMALKNINEREGQPFTFYLHPWEVDPDQPRFNHAGMLSRFRHYNNLHKTAGRFERLLRDFKFGPIPAGDVSLQSKKNSHRTTQTHTKLSPAGSGGNSQRFALKNGAS